MLTTSSNIEMRISNVRININIFSLNLLILLLLKKFINKILFLISFLNPHTLSFFLSKNAK